MKILLLLLMLSLAARADVVLRLGASGLSSGYPAQVAETLCRQLGQRGPAFRLALDRAESRTDLAALHAVLAGDLHLALLRSSPLANFHRPLGLLSLPYLFPGGDPETRRWLKGEPGARLLASLQGSHLRALGYFELGPRLLATRGPLGPLSELAGKRVLVAQNRFAVDWMESLGAAVLPGPPERADELLHSQADLWALETTLVDWNDLGLSSQLPYLLESGAGLECLVLVANEGALARLSEKDRTWLETAVGQTRAAAALQLRQRQDRARALPGLHWRSAPPDDRQRWAAQSAPVRQRALRLLGPPWSEELR